MLDAIIAVTTRYRPVATWKVVAVAVADHGETTAKPTPAPNASRISVTAAAATPPARMAPQETAETPASAALRGVSKATDDSTAMCVLHHSTASCVGLLVRLDPVCLYG